MTTYVLKVMTENDTPFVPDYDILFYGRRYALVHNPFT